jgi:hypothetical protein
MAAYLHSLDMETNQFFSHTGSDGSDPGDRITREGYDWWTYGENIAVNYPTVSAVMQGWLSSEGHCRNIMNPAFEEIGAAYAEGPFQGTPAASTGLSTSQPPNKADSTPQHRLGSPGRTLAAGRQTATPGPPSRVNEKF